MDKIKCAIVGSGNIGTDLLFKLRHDPYLELALVVGVDPNSEGLALARRHGYQTTHEAMDGFLKYHEGIDIVFEATSAKVHAMNAPTYEKLGKIAIDLYGEIVSTIASKSAGPGTRQNIDEFTQTTARVLERVGGAKQGKAIIILNPAEPPIMMKNTVFAAVEKYDREAMLASIEAAVEAVQEYVPGYHLKTDPVFDDNKVTVFVEVEGAGAYLPKYAGNLDIETAAAVKVGQEFAKHLQAKRAATAQPA
jgi:acetaldehyde dehydrogenase